MDSNDTAAENETSPSKHSKRCTLCSTPRDVLIRCQIDTSGSWHFVCPGKCWRGVSGGKIDGDDSHKQYRYGGTWKNKHDAVSGKKKKKRNKAAQAVIADWMPPPEDDDSHGKDGSSLAMKYTQNDKVMWENQEWTCRRSHFSSYDKLPGKGWTFWKESS